VDRCHGRRDPARRQPRRGGRDGGRPRAIGRGGAAEPRLLEPRHVRELRGARARLRRRARAHRWRARPAAGGVMLSVRLPSGSGRPTRPIARRIDKARMAVIDEPLLWGTAILLGFGRVRVYSASSAMPDSPRYARLDNTHFLLRRLLSIGIGVAAGVLAFATPMRQWQRLSPLLFIVGLALLFTVLVIGQVTLGATRWIRIGPLSLQP